MRRRAIGGGAAAVVALLVAGTGARAGDEHERANTLLREGVAQLGDGKPADALASFRAAYALVPSPKVVFNIGLAQRALGEDAEALRAFEQFLEEAPFAPEPSRAEAQRISAELRPRLGFVEVVCDAREAAVLIDGKEVGRTPLRAPWAVRPGRHEIEVRKTGAASHRTALLLVAGQKLRVEASLAPVAAALPVPAGAALAGEMPASRAAPAPAGAAAAEPVEVPRVGEARYRGAALGLAIGGAAAAGAGLFFHLRSIDEYDTFNAMPASTPTGHCSRGYADRGGTECAGVLDRADRARYFAIAGYVVGGAALAVAAGLVFLPGPAPGGSAAAVAWSCTPDLLQNGIRCALRF